MIDHGHNLDLGQHAMHAHGNVHSLKLYVVLVAATLTAAPIGTSMIEAYASFKERVSKSRVIAQFNYWHATAGENFCLVFPADWRRNCQAGAVQWYRISAKDGHKDFSSVAIMRMADLQLARTDLTLAELTELKGLLPDGIAKAQENDVFRLLSQQLGEVDRRLRLAEAGSKKSPSSVSGPKAVPEPRRFHRPRRSQRSDTAVRPSLATPPCVFPFYGQYPDCGIVTPAITP